MSPETALAIYQAGAEEVVEVLCALDARIAALEKQVEEQKKRIARLTKNSSNSGKRPSSDDITKGKRKTKSGEEEEPKRKKGGQAGHPKHERMGFAPEELNHVHVYTAQQCSLCSSEHIIFLDAEPQVIEQIELKELVVIKEAHRSYPYFCMECNEIHYAPFPNEVVRAGLFKERLTALVAYLKNVCHASFSTIRKFIRDVLGEKVSRGYLAKLIQKVSQCLDRPYEELLNGLPLEPKVNVDETGHKDNGERFWTWVFKAELYVLFRLDKSRSSAVLIEVLGKEFDGVLGCDYFSVYRKYMKDCDITVQFCLAHLIRDIKFLVDFPDPATQSYGRKLLAEVRKLFEIIRAREQQEEAVFRSALQAAKAAIITETLEEVPSRLNKEGKEEKSEAQAMARRFRLHGEQYFEFITTPGIEPTNNLTEQAIRFIVIDRHVTQGTRSLKGRKASERLWTVIATCALQGRSAFEFILNAVQAYFYDEPAPSLLPPTPT